MDTKSIATRFTLGKNERLKSRKLISQLFSEGKAISAYPLRLLYLSTPASPENLKAGFTVSSKNFKKAVDRNRIKRLMREAYRLQKHQLKKDSLSIILFFIYTGKEMIDFETTKAKVDILIKNVVLQLNNN